MSGPDHPCAIFAASPAEAFSHLFGSLKFQINKRGSGFNGGLKLSLGFLPSAVPISRHSASGYERSIRRRENRFDLILGQWTAVKSYLRHLDGWGSVFKEIQNLLGRAVLQCDANHVLFF